MFPKKSDKIALTLLPKYPLGLSVRTPGSNIFTDFSLRFFEDNLLKTKELILKSTIFVIYIFFYKDLPLLLFEHPNLKTLKGIRKKGNKQIQTQILQKLIAH